MAKYKANRSFGIPDGKYSDGRQKMKYFIEGETYELTEGFVKNIGGLGGVRPSFILVIEKPKPKAKPKAKPRKKTEKKPDIRTR